MSLNSDRGHYVGFAVADMPHGFPTSSFGGCCRMQSSAAGCGGDYGRGSTDLRAKFSPRWLAESDEKSEGHAQAQLADGTAVDRCAYPSDPT
jgi:hypothetical protein